MWNLARISNIITLGIKRSRHIIDPVNVIYNRLSWLIIYRIYIAASS